MSTSVTLIFFYFCSSYSLAAGIYSLLVSFASFMIWTYWAECRVYSLWVLLTTIQSLLFLTFIKEGKPVKRLWVWLSVTHILLSLTIVLSIIQMAAVSFILWIYFDKDLRKYIFSLIVPFLICSYYFWHAPKYKFMFIDSPLQLINACIPKDRLLIFAIYVFFTLILILLRKEKLPAFKKIINYALVERGRAFVYLIFTCLLLVGNALLLTYLKIKETPLKQGFAVSNRYFIALTPAGIIATVLFSIFMIRESKNKIMRAAVFIILLALSAVRLYRTDQFIHFYTVLFTDP